MTTIRSNTSEYTIEINSDRIEEEIARAFKSAMFALGVKFTEEISLNKWQWIAAPSPRDIVDTGRLRSSQSLEFESPTQAIFNWATNYAVYVHEGVQFRNGSRTPARRWTEAALNDFDLEQAIANELEF